MPEERARRGRGVAIQKRVVKLGIVDCSSGRSRRHVEIEIASEYCRRVQGVPPGVGQDLVQLRAAQRIITLAFQMQVVGGYRLARYVRFADEREPSPDSLLKGRNFRKEPVWAPEIRLLLETDDSEVRQGPTRECGLAMIGRQGASALGQFLEFASEHIIHLQLLRYFPRNVGAVRPLGVQIGFLQ